MKKKIYASAEEITQKFIEDGWSKNISFSELTLEEAKEKGYLFAIGGLIKGRKFFIMNNGGHIYNDKGEVLMYNIKVSS